MAQGSFGWIALGAGLLLSFDAELGRGAAALNCQSAADCGGAPATCELTSYQTCAGKDPACPAGSSCGDKPSMPAQPGCSPYVEGICRQPYELPCQVDTDCGVGFRCTEQIHSVCMGSGSTGSPGGAPPESHEECHEVRGTFACELIDTACKVDSECAASLRCQLDHASSCGTLVASPIGADGGVADTTDCASGSQLRCAPADYFGVRAGKLADGGVGGIEDFGSDTGDTATNAAPDASAPPSVQRGQADGVEAATPEEEDSGCSLSGRTPRVDVSLLALLASLSLCLRRRRAAARD